MQNDEKRRRKNINRSCHSLPNYYSCYSCPYCRTLGASLANEMLLFNRKLTAGEARAAGLVSQVCTALHCTALHCTTHHCIAPHCTSLHSPALEPAGVASSQPPAGRVCHAAAAGSLRQTALVCPAVQQGQVPV